MAKSRVVQAIDNVQQALAPLFKQHGFRKRGRTFNRITLDGLTHVVNFQTGASDPPATTYIPGLRENKYGLFTVNLGVYIPEVAAVEGHPPAKWVQEYHCAIRSRLAQTMGLSRDVWWNTKDEAAAIDEVRSWLEHGGLPLLDRFPSREDVLEAVDRDIDWVDFAIMPPRIMAAIMLNARGNHDKALLRLRQQHDWAIREGKSGHAEHVSALQAKLGR